MAFSYSNPTKSPEKNIWRVFIGEYTGTVKNAYDSVRSEFITWEGGGFGVSPSTVADLIGELTQIGVTKQDDTTFGIKNDKAEVTAELGEIQLSVNGSFEINLINGIEENIEAVRALNGIDIVVAFVNASNWLTVVFTPVRFNNNELYQGGDYMSIKITGEKKASHPNGVNMVVTSASIFTIT